MRKYLEEIRTNGISGDLITKIIDEHHADSKKRIEFYERYKASIYGVPILNRKPVEYEDFETGSLKRIDNKVNNKLNNAFDAEIVDTKIGYMFGYPIAYEVDKRDGNLESFSQALSDFNIRNNVEDKDSEWGKKAAICGYGARLAYIDREGKERIMNVDPWECVFFSESDYTEPEYGLRYYLISDNITQVEFYDNENYYIFNNKGGNGYRLIEFRPHTFDYCPLFGLPNNEELMADAEKVMNLIDAYDRTLSDANNEIEQYRLAYLVLKGMGADEETLSQLKRSGIFELLGDNDEVNYLTKNINDTMIENHLDRLEENILRFAKSVNFSDESFGGSITGVAMRFKLLALENKCISFERKMAGALRHQFKVICSAWTKKGICSNEDYLKVFFTFKRNLPANLIDEADASMKLKGLVSDRTRVGLLSFVDDVEYELEEMQKEAEGLVDLDALGGEENGGFGQDSGADTEVPRGASQ